MVLSIESTKISENDFAIDACQTYHYNIINFIIIDFLEGIKAARSDFGNTHIFDCMYDVKTWLKQHTEPMYNHSHPHIFRFRKGPDGHCYMQYKKWRQSEWEPQSERNRHGVRILKVHVSNYHIIIIIL